MPKQLGLFRLIPYEESERIVDNLSVLYEDVYDSLENVRENVRDLEKELDRAFYGENYGKPIDESRGKKHLTA